MSFSSPLNPGAPGFQAEMRLGSGYSYDGSPCGSAPGQTSTVKVNGTAITDGAGCNDDSSDANPADGNLITVGGNDDSFAAMLPTIAADHERYSLTGQISPGDTSIFVETLNPSNNDNIFLAVFQVSGEASVTTAVPEPSTVGLFGMGLLALGLRQRMRAKR